MAVITGTDGNDKVPYGNDLRGTDAADQIYGLAGNDNLIGFGGNDTLEGGAGADELFGDAGFDYASYRGSTKGVHALLNDGGTGVGDEGDRLYSIEGVIGSTFGDSLIGNGGRNILYGEGGADGLSGYGGDDILYGGAGKDVLTGGLGNDELRGGDGVDTASFNFNDGTPVVADLASGTATGAGNDRLFSIENLAGTTANDRLAGNGGANAVDGFWGADVLLGRGGADRFVYNSSYDSTRGLADRIVDFSRAEGDKIALTNVDANAQVNGNEAFQFIGQAQFTGAGQLRWYQSNGDTVVEANTTDAYAGAEMVFVLDPLVSLQATDFVL
jgi:Ca2+-binding RTX toxin-like protein